MERKQKVDSSKPVVAEYQRGPPLVFHLGQDPGRWGDGKTALQLQLAAAEDAARIWNMQRIAFQKLLDKYQGFDTSPASEPLEKMSGWLAQKGRYYYFIKVNDEIAGVVSIMGRKDGSPKRLAPIFLLPQYEGRGLAQEAVREAEWIHDSHTWELDTVLQEEKLYYLYEEMGYRRTGELTPVNDRITLVFYEKE